MRKFLLLLFAVSVALGVAAKDTVSHDPAVLPEAARTVIKNNYKADISFIKIDKSMGRVSDYEVVMTDGSEVKFDRQGNWREAESPRTGSVPDYFVPKSVRDYVNANHKGQKVVGIEKDHNGYEVSLTNGIDIKFDRQGAFVRYDD